jgi:hypothetical protein
VGQDFSRDGTQENKKRVNHAAAIMGGMLVAHGGFNSDENYMYNQIEICDLSNLDLLLTYYSLQEMASRSAQGSSWEKQEVNGRSGAS